MLCPPTTTTNNDYQWQDGITGSVQTFYVSTTALLYCGVLRAYFSGPAPIEWHFVTQPEASTATARRWCDASRGCDAL